jgi:PD-(D/E)XK endonuclease
MLSDLDTAQRYGGQADAMGHPKAIGETSQLAIMLGLDRAGYAFFVPFGGNTRYDLVIDEGDRLARVQCKTGGKVSTWFPSITFGCGEKVRCA